MAEPGYAYYDYVHTYHHYFVQLGKEDLFNQLIEQLKQEQEERLESEKIALSSIEEVFDVERLLKRNTKTKINSIAAVKEAIASIGLTNSFEVKSSIIRALKEGKS